MNNGLIGGLSASERNTLRRILSTYADHIERVDIFGSRAQGKHRPNSDLDFVVHGNFTEEVVDRLWTLCQDSNLPFSVDVKSHQATPYAPLRAHRDEMAQPLFSHDALTLENQAKL